MLNLPFISQNFTSNCLDKDLKSGPKSSKKLL